VAAFAERDATVLGLHLPDAVKEAQNLDQRVAPAEADVTDTADISAAGAEIGAVAVITCTGELRRDQSLVPVLKPQGVARTPFAGLAPRDRFACNLIGDEHNTPQRAVL